MAGRPAGATEPRWWHAVAIALIVAATTASCGRQPYTDYEPPTDSTGSAPGPDATFAATITQLPSELRITYRLVNTGAVPLVAYDGVPAEDMGHLVVSAYVTARKDGTVEIAQRTFTVPPGITLDGPSLLRGTILQPGKNLADEVRVSLPLHPRREYLEPAEMSLPDPVRTVVFCLGVTRQDAFPEDMRNGVNLEDDGASPSPSKDGPLFTHPSPQHLFCSAKHRLEPPA